MAWPVPPGRLPAGLGTEQGHEQDRQPFETAYHLVEHREAGLVGPVQIVQGHDQWHLGGLPRQQLAEQIHDPALPCPRLDLELGQAAKGHREDFAQDRDVFRQIRSRGAHPEPAREGLVQLAVHVRAIESGCEPQQAAQEVCHQLIGAGA